MSDNLKRLLDREIARFDDDKLRASVGVPSRAVPLNPNPDQLTLFDLSEDGATLVSHDGQTL